MVLVCDSLDGRVKIVNKVKLVCQVPEKCYHVDGSCMCQPGWKGKDCKQGKVKVFQEPEKCDRVDGSCMCQSG